jgi:hypothetical protein
MWGSNTTLSFPVSGSVVDLPDTQLIDAPMPEPCVASLFFQAEVTAPPSLTYAISYLTLSLTIGLGRVSVNRQITWNGVPRLGVPIVFTIPFLPVVQILATVRGGGQSFASEPATVLCTAEVAPIGRFPMANSLTFGMAKPGEADGADDELLDELEPHSPDEVDIMRAAQDEGHDPTEALAEHEGAARRPSHIPHEAMPPRVSRVVKSLTKRLGRAPRLRELPPWAQQELHRHIRGGAR